MDALGMGVVRLGRGGLFFLRSVGIPPSPAYWESRSTLATWSTSRPASSRTRAKRNSKTLPTNGRFSRIPMKLSLTKKPLPVCRSFARTNADPHEHAKPICSPGLYDVRIVVRNCTTAPATVLKPDRITSYAPLPVKRARISVKHFIRAVVLEEGTLQHMRLVIFCVASCEDAFRRALGAKRNK